MNSLWCVCVRMHSVVSDSLQPHRLYVGLQAPLSMEFSRQEYWSGLPFPTLGKLSDPGIKPTSLTLLALATGSLQRVPPGKL